ncbi:hypothetical protein HK097_007332 [Rhizophlyctis rosea]|uniref:Rieske domain-containing protein n=1 Tax=Rhizophlyctis rosea TaxID=64517 RepID=A0AAD5SEW2_9FUNG|nr:hypothetical protein HK097_007332 [Rhizophlyctis rosea]
MPSVNVCNKKDIEGKRRALVTLRFDPEEGSIEAKEVEAVLVGSERDELYRCVEAVCPHSGGPLHLGDIEDTASGDPAIICPWHAYRFSLNNGESSSCESLWKAKVFPVEAVGDDLSLHLEDGVKVKSVKLFEVPPKPPKAKAPIKKTEQQKVESDPTLVDWAIRILQTSDPTEKVRLTLKVAELWRGGEIAEVGYGTPPDQPFREETLEFVAPGKARRLGKGGSLESRIAILHSLANIEQWAIDLAWDIIARFAPSPSSTSPPLPRDFYTDFIKVAADEAKHYTFLVDRLGELGSGFGKLPVHGGLWDSAWDTKDCLKSRLGIVHMVHEARGLDVNPQTIKKFAKAGDKESVEKLGIIHSDEITHVATGQKWFTYMCALEKLDRYDTFHQIVRELFRGPLKPPFNDEDRLRAGLDANFYRPLAEKVAA